MFEIVEMGREDGDGGKITNSACTLRRVYWHVPLHSRVFGQRSHLKRIPLNFNTRN